MVNKNLGKKSGLTYKMVKDRYEHFRSRCIKNMKEFKEVEKLKNNVPNHYMVLNQK